MRQPRTWSPDPKPQAFWSPEARDAGNESEEKNEEIVNLLPAKFAEAIIRLRDGGGMSFSMHRRPYLEPIYNRWHKRIVVIGGRQIEKSTFLGNQIWIPAAGVRGYRSLYVAPTDLHTRTFAYDKLEATWAMSPHLQDILGRPRIDNLNHKEFNNGGSILLRSAYLTARSARGIPADQLLIDEAQEMISSHLPVLQETLTHSHHDVWGRRILIAGTALTPECMIGEYWADHSTQGEWVINCSINHENIIELENLSEKGIICSKCGGELNPLNGRWVHQFPSRKEIYIGYRIPQVINPMVLDHWDDIVIKLRSFSNAQLQNEVLGRSYEIGTRPISRSHLLRSERQVPMSPRIEYVEMPVMGVDWGYGDVSHTVVTIGGWNQRNNFQVIYAKKFRLGEEIDPEYQLKFIYDLYAQYKVVMIGVDYGAGWGQNARMKARLGERVNVFYYSHGQKHALKWDRKSRLYTANRSAMMADLFESIKTEKFELFKGYTEEFGNDFMNVATTQDSMGRVLYTHAPSRPDDSVHSLNYAFMVARLMRRDIRAIEED